MGDVGSFLFEKDDVNISPSKYAAQLDDLIEAFRQAGPAYARMFQEGFIPRLPELFNRQAGYYQSLAPIGAELTSRGRAKLGAPTAVPRRRDDSGFQPILDELLTTARRPIDDELGDYFRDRYARDLDSRLATRGLIGQGTGERLTSEALRDYDLNARDRADARRILNTQAADALQGSLTSRDLADLNARLGAERFDLDTALKALGAGTQYSGQAALGENQAWRAYMDDLNTLGDRFFKFYGASAPLVQTGLNADMQKNITEEQLTQANKTGLGQILGYAKDIAGIVGAFYGGGALMGGGDNSAQAVPNINYNPGGQTGAFPGSGGAYSFPGGGGGGGGMTPWGTPVSGYSLGGSSGPAGGYTPSAYPILSPGNSGIDYTDPAYRPNYMNKSFIYG